MRGLHAGIVAARRLAKRVAIGSLHAGTGHDECLAPLRNVSGGEGRLNSQQVLLLDERLAASPVTLSAAMLALDGVDDDGSPAPSRRSRCCCRVAISCGPSSVASSGIG